MPEFRGEQQRTWSVLYLAIAGAWLGIYALSLGHPATPALGALDRSFDAELWRTLCTARPSFQNLPEVMAMWSLMCGAMMLPTALPFVRTYREIGSIERARGAVSLPGLVLGYLGAWLGFGLIAGLLQTELAARAVLSPHGILLSPTASAALLITAGVYQLSPWKRWALTACRQPMHYLMAHWRAGTLGAVQLGFGHGAMCVGCCWALMLLAFVGGTMNLAWMGVATVLMALEKLGRLGRHATPIVGVALIGAGGFTLAS